MGSEMCIRDSSTLYNEQIDLSEHFFYHERLIKCGKKEHGENILYLFEDSEMKKEEEYTFYKQHDENQTACGRPNLNKLSDNYR